MYINACAFFGLQAGIFYSDQRTRFQDGGAEQFMRSYLIMWYNVHCCFSSLVFRLGILYCNQHTRFQLEWADMTSALKKTEKQILHLIWRSRVLRLLWASLSISPPHWIDGWPRLDCLIAMVFSCVLGCAALHYISRQTMRDIHAYTLPHWCQRGCLIAIFCFCVIGSAPIHRSIWILPQKHLLTTNHQKSFLMVQNGFWMVPDGLSFVQCRPLGTPIYR